MALTVSADADTLGRPTYSDRPGFDFVRLEFYLRSDR
jgi:hypothetical protein